jgi:prevent-host-death family protein
MNVPVRDLKNGLSAYLRLVRRGQRVIVTDRGQPVAELAPVGEARLSLDQRLLRLVEAGELRLPKGKRHFEKVVPSRVRGRRVSSTLLEDRD